MADSHADVSKHVKSYIAVFIALAVFTVLTVLASGIEVSTPAHITIALVIAAIKATLVAAIFMHLKWEKGHAIWFVLALCAIFFVLLLFLPVLTTNDLPLAVKHGSWG